jgi:hypothetical protein
MVISDVYKIPIVVSLLIVAGLITGSILVSWLRPAAMARAGRGSGAVAPEAAGQ